MAGDSLLEVLPLEECLDLLRAFEVGRIAFDVDEFPVVLPVNYRLVEFGAEHLIALRTRPGNVIDQAPWRVAFQIDGTDRRRQAGWSVLVRGSLRHVDDPGALEFRAQFDSQPWIGVERDAWLVIDPFEITGRRLLGPPIEWALHEQAYR
jgi:Pyridoxamine 5'-phosphate oxidase